MYHAKFNSLENYKIKKLKNKSSTTTMKQENDFKHNIIEALLPVNLT